MKAKEGLQNPGLTRVACDGPSGEH
jgi:hypothetical protein